MPLVSASTTLQPSRLFAKLARTEVQNEGWSPVLVPLQVECLNASVAFTGEVCEIWAVRLLLDEAAFFDEGIEAAFQLVS